MTEPQPAPDDGTPEAVQVVLETIDAYLRGDTMEVAKGAKILISLGESSFYGSLASFAYVAAAAVPRGTEPGITWVPALFMGHPPRQVNIERDPVAAFVFRFLAATLNRDEAYRIAVYDAFINRNGDPDRDGGAAAREAAAAIVLLVQLAARGKRALLEQHARPHQHPQARRRNRGRPGPHRPTQE